MQSLSAACVDFLSYLYILDNFVSRDISNNDKSEEIIEDARKAYNEVLVLIINFNIQNENSKLRLVTICAKEYNTTTN